MITDEEIQTALHSVANDHDTEKAVRTLIARAWADGYHAGTSFAQDGNPYGETSP